MPVSLAVAREFLEVALSKVRSRADARAIGERIVELIELEELQECRTLVEVKKHGCKHTSCAHHRRAGVTLNGEPIVAKQCLECGAFVRETMHKDWDGTVYTFPPGARPRRLVI